MLESLHHLDFKKKIIVSSKVVGLPLGEGQLIHDHMGTCRQNGMEVHIRTWLCDWLLFPSPDAPPNPHEESGNRAGGGMWRGVAAQGTTDTEVSSLLGLQLHELCIRKSA